MAGCPQSTVHQGTRHDPSARRAARRTPGTALGQNREKLCLRRARRPPHTIRPVRPPQPTRHLSLHAVRSEEHTSELQSLMRISYDVFCLKQKINKLYTHSKHEYNI